MSDLPWQARLAARQRLLSQRVALLGLTGSDSLRRELQAASLSSRLDCRRCRPPPAGDLLLRDRLGLVDMAWQPLKAGASEGRAARVFAPAELPADGAGHRHRSMQPAECLRPHGLDPHLHAAGHPRARLAPRCSAAPAWTSRCSAARRRGLRLLGPLPAPGGPLRQGIVFGRSVACPLHNWTISLTEGCAKAPDEDARRPSGQAGQRRHLSAESRAGTRLALDLPGAQGRALHPHRRGLTWRRPSPPAPTAVSAADSRRGAVRIAESWRSPCPREGGTLPEFAVAETLSTCPYCGVGCGVVIEHDGQQITGVRGDPDHRPTSVGCAARAATCT